MTSPALSLQAPLSPLLPLYPQHLHELLPHHSLMAMQTTNQCLQVPCLLSDPALRDSGAHHRVQRREGAIQECDLHRMGRRRPGEATTALEALLQQHGRPDFRGGLAGQGSDEQGRSGVPGDHPGPPDAAQRHSRVCQQAGHAGMPDTC